MRSSNRTPVRTILSDVTPAQRRDAVAISLTMAAVAMSYGAMSQAGGLELWQTLALALLVFGGASEILFVGVIASGGAILPAVLGGLLVNSRNSAYGMNLGTYAPAGKLSTSGKRGAVGWRSAVAAHFANDESVAFAAGSSPDSSPDSGTGSDTASASGSGSETNQDTDRHRWHRFLLMGALLLIAWVGGAVAGQLLGQVMDTSALGIDAVFPVVLVAMVISSLRTRRNWIIAIAGMVCAAVTTPFVPPGLGAVMALSVLVPWFFLERRPR